MGSHGDVPVGSTHGSMRLRIPKAIAYGNKTPGRGALFLKTRSGHSEIKRSPPGSMLGNDSRRYADLSHIQFTTGMTGGGWLSNAVPSLAGSGAKPAVRIPVETFCGDMAYAANGSTSCQRNVFRTKTELRGNDYQRYFLHAFAHRGIAQSTCGVVKHGRCRFRHEHFL